MGNHLFETGRGALELSRGFLLSLIDGLEGHQLVTRAGGVGNHVMWVCGHIAWTEDYFAKGLAQRERATPEPWDELFGMGSMPTESLSDYPAFDDVLGHLHSTRESLLSSLSELTETQLLEPMEEALSQFAKHKAMLMSSLAFHEGVHTGQVLTVRSSLGLPRMK